MGAVKAVLLLVAAGGRDEAERLGETLVERRLAACCSVVPVVHSFYRWEGKLAREHEALLLVKTTRERAGAAEALLREQHSYELPEILEVDVAGGSAAYLDWLQGQVSGPDEELEVDAPSA